MGKTNNLMKTLLILLVLGLVFVAAACGQSSNEPNNAEEPAATPAKPTETEKEAAAEDAAPKPVQWMLPGAGALASTGAELAVFKLLEEAGNMELEILPTSIDVYLEKFNITLASDNIPDIISLLGGVPPFEALNNFGPRGMFVPLSDHWDKIPNLKKWIDKYPVAAQALKAHDGKIYIAPGVRDYPPFNQGFAIREDLLNKNNIQLEDIRTTDDLYNAFVVLKAELGGPVMSARSGLINVSRFAQMFGTAFFINFYSDWDKQFINPFVLENTREAVAFLNRMYQDGILHPDWASMTDAEWSQGIASADQNLGFYADNMQNINGSNIELFKAGRSPDDQTGWAGLVPPQYNGTLYPWAAGPNFVTDYGRAVSAKTGALDNILQALDFAYDENNLDKFFYGIEGETYRLREDGTPEYLIDSSTDETYGFGFNQNYSMVFREMELFSYAYLPKDGGFEQAYHKYKSVYTFTNPAIQLTKEEVELLQNLKTPFDTFASENLVRFINGQKPLSEWDAFVAETLERYKGDEIVAVYNEALSRIQ